jgi:o-succinylbenzoate synthase
MKAYYKKYILKFKTPGGTSRGVLRQKETWFLILEDKNKFGIGECGLFRGLSADDVPNYEDTLEWVCNNIDTGLDDLLTHITKFPSIQFGLEQAFKSLASTNPFVLFPSAFTNDNQPLPINGLIWMGEPSYMRDQIVQRIEEGFRCIKLKIGAIDFDVELELLASIRERYSEDEIEIRVDANGAFGHEEALNKLTCLAELGIHSTEQPIKPGALSVMANLCEQSPIPIALDEELIGVHGETNKRELLQIIKPQYIILKPSLVGGFKGSGEWINLANSLGIKWWITSALESNIGLNAIAQWTYTLSNQMPQGLGTGSLFTNNFECPLEVQQGNLYYKRDSQWEDNLIRSICT